MAHPATPLRISLALPRLSSFSRTSRQLHYISTQRLTVRNNQTTSKSILPVIKPSLHIRRALEQSHSPRNIQPTPVLNPGINSVTGVVRDVHPESVYKPPTSGLLARLPASWVPYAELIRLDKPTGTYYLFLPCLFSTLMAAPLSPIITPPSTILATTALFFTGALVMRGAGCTINDLWDRDLDPHVARTKLRPIARGALSVQQAIPFLGVQLLTGLGVLLQFPSQCLFYGIPSLILVGMYPLAKRVTNYPQLVLGFAFSWGAIMGFPALGIDLLSHTPALISAICLYGSGIAWTLIYDMIYAYQDIRDDAKAGIKSIALAQEGNAKLFLSAMAVLQVGLLAGAGAAVGVGPLFYLGTCGGAALTLAQMIRKVNLKDIDDCWAWFKKGAGYTGGAISMGLLVEYLAQYFGLYKREEGVVVNALGMD